MTVMVCGHRGAAGIEPENTLRGFRRAAALGCDTTECDVRLTRDGHLILMHDETVDRTTTGTGKVAELTFEQIRSLDAGLGEHVPTLDEVLETVAGRLQLLVELKGEGTESAAMETVKRHKLERDCIFTSFQLDRIRRVREIDPALRTGAIFGSAVPDLIQRAVDAGAANLNVQFRHLSRRIVEAAHVSGLRVRAWNPDTEHDMRAALALGPDGVGSNRPDVLLRLLGR